MRIGSGANSEGAATGEKHILTENNVLQFYSVFALSHSKDTHAHLLTFVRANFDLMKRFVMIFGETYNFYNVIFYKPHFMLSFKQHFCLK